MSENDEEKIAKKWINILKISLIAIISIFLVLFLLTRISIDDFITVISDVQPLYLILGFVLYIFAYIFRTLRFYYLLGRKIGIRDLFGIVCVHNMINTILPARTGELSYIYLLKKHKISLEERIATLVSARIFDFIIIACFFLISVIIIEDLPEIILNALWIIFFCMVALVVLLVSLLYYSESFKNVVLKLAIRLKINRFKITGKILSIIEKTIVSFEIIKARKIITKTIILSICTWLTMFLMYYLFISAFRIGLEFIEIIIIVSFIAFLPLLPFYGAGGFGTMEVAMTIFLVAFGVPEAVAIVTSFGLHIVGFVYVIILGLLGTLTLGIKRNQMM